MEKSQEEVDKMATAIFLVGFWTTSVVTMSLAIIFRIVAL